MQKVAILVSDENQYFFPMVESDQIVIINAWNDEKKRKNMSRFNWCNKLHIAVGYFLGDWINHIKEYCKIIILDGCYDGYLERYLDRKAKNIPKYVFCWNWKKRLGHVLWSKYPIYSYSPNDCKELGLLYQSTFYSYNVKLAEKKLQYDVVFVGRMKSRGRELWDIYQNLTQKRLNLKFYVVGNNMNEYGEFPNESSFLSYARYLEIVEKSISILDICQEGQDGLSLRVMESIFLKKKLITNNRYIENYDFYIPQNIFILGKDVNIGEFLKTPYYPISQKIIQKYDVQEWVKNFK